MSRTDKDRPWWVVNNDTAHKYTRHDHLHFGEPVYRTRRVLDKNGKPLIEEVPIIKRAFDMVHGPFGSYSGTPAAVQKAKRAIGAGRPNEMIDTGITWKKHVTERVLIGYIADHCTVGEKVTEQDRWGWLLPCTPDHDPTDKWWHHKDGSARHDFSQTYYRGKRRASRDTLRKTANAYNSGTDPEDYEDDINPLTDHHKHGVWWYLW